MWRYGEISHLGMKECEAVCQAVGNSALGLYGPFTRGDSEALGEGAARAELEDTGDACGVEAVQTREWRRGERWQWEVGWGWSCGAEAKASAAADAKASRRQQAKGGRGQMRQDTSTPPR